MKRMVGFVPALGTVFAVVLSLSTPAVADVVVNNVLSPGSVTVVGTGSRVYDSDYYGGPGYYREHRYHRHHHHSGYQANYYDPHAYGRCWVSTDRDRGFGYWGRCRFR